MSRASRGWVGDTLQSVIDFGKVVSTELVTGAYTLLAKVRGNDADPDDDVPAEEVDRQQVWGHAAILWRPLTDTEVVIVRRGEEMLPIASRETRWQIDLSEGDVVLRALGENKPRLILRADGTCTLEADEIRLGDNGATEKIGLGTAIKGHLDNLKTFLDELKVAHNTHKHGGVTVGAGTSAVPDVTVAGSNPAVPDVESRHKVEN